MRRANVVIFGKWRLMRAWAALRSPAPALATSSASGSSIMLRQNAFQVSENARTQPLGASTRRPPASVGQRFLDSLEEGGALGGAGGGQALEVFGEAHIGIELRAMLVEMKEG